MAAGALFVLACRETAPVAASEIPGVYTLATNEMVDTLVVDADGTFRHQLWNGATLAVSEHGRWQMSAYPDGGAAVELSPISPIERRSTRVSTRPGIWLARIGRARTGAPKLPVNEDIGVSLVRVGPSP
jgi:hypothetical protein